MSCSGSCVLDIQITSFRACPHPQRRQHEANAWWIKRPLRHISKPGPYRHERSKHEKRWLVWIHADLLILLMSFACRVGLIGCQGSQPTPEKACFSSLPPDLLRLGNRWQASMQKYVTGPVARDPCGLPTP